MTISNSVPEEEQLTALPALPVYRKEEFQIVTKPQEFYPTYIHPATPAPKRRPSWLSSFQSCFIAGNGSKRNDRKTRRFSKKLAKAKWLFTDNDQRPYETLETREKPSFVQQQSLPKDRNDSNHSSPLPPMRTIDPLKDPFNTSLPSSRSKSSSSLFEKKNGFMNNLQPTIQHNPLRLNPPDHPPNRWSWTNSQAPSTPRLAASHLPSSAMDLPEFHDLDDAAAVRAGSESDSDSLIELQNEDEELQRIDTPHQPIDPTHDPIDQLHEQISKLLLEPMDPSTHQIMDRPLGTTADNISPPREEEQKEEGSKKPKPKPLSTSNKPKTVNHFLFPPPPRRKLSKTKRVRPKTAG